MLSCNKNRLVTIDMVDGHTSHMGSINWLNTFSICIQCHETICAMGRTDDHREYQFLWENIRAITFLD